MEYEFRIRQEICCQMRAAQRDMISKAEAVQPTAPVMEPNWNAMIVDREEWEQVQELPKANAKPYRGNTASHRYAGLLTCGDCGSTFVPRFRCWNGSHRLEYLCKSYMHHGKEFCPSHRIRESELDARVRQYAEELRSWWTAEQADLRRIHRLWEMKRPAINAHIADLYNEIQRLGQAIDDILMEKITSS